MEDCIEWSGAIRSDGYGVRRVNGRLWAVHRLAWTEAYGDIPEGLYVCHRCDNKICYRVEHLFLGTPKDNNQDAARKGRTNNGMSSREYCKWGHPLSGANLYVRPDGRGRQCRECASIRSKIK